MSNESTTSTTPRDSAIMGADLCDQRAFGASRSTADEVTVIRLSIAAAGATIKELRENVERLRAALADEVERRDNEIIRLRDELDTARAEIAIRVTMIESLTKHRDALIDKLETAKHGRYYYQSEYDRVIKERDTARADLSDMTLNRNANRDALSAVEDHAYKLGFRLPTCGVIYWPTDRARLLCEFITGLHTRIAELEAQLAARPSAPTCEEVLSAVERISRRRDINPLLLTFKEARAAIRSAFAAHAPAEPARDTETLYVCDHAGKSTWCEESCRSRSAHPRQACCEIPITCRHVNARVRCVPAPAGQEVRA